MRGLRNARLGIRPPGGANRFIPDTRPMKPEQARDALEKSARDLDRDIKELSQYTRDADDYFAGHDDRLDTLEAGRPRVIAAVSLADGTTTLIEHGLAEAPSFVRESPPRSADPKVLLAATGRVTFVPSHADTTEYDETTHIALRADGWGATIVVDVMVIP